MSIDNVYKLNRDEKNNTSSKSVFFFNFENECVDLSLQVRKVQILNPPPMF